MNESRTVIRDLHHFGDELTVAEAAARLRAGTPVTVTVVEPAPPGGDPRGIPRPGFDVTVTPDATQPGQPPEVSWAGAACGDPAGATLLAGALGIAGRLASLAATTDEASGPAPAHADLEPRLSQADLLGRRHGKAAVYWQIGDSGDPAALEFYRDLLRGIAEGDPEITGLYKAPDLTARWYYQRGNLAADLCLPVGGPVLNWAAQAYLAAAREEFWAEAARLARRRLATAPPRPDSSEETPR
jgi:hypothetical protein